MYTRNLNEITDRLGAVDALVAGLPGGDLVLDGEALASTTTARRAGSRTRWATSAPMPSAGRGRGLAAYFFDVLHAGGEPVVDEPLAVRRDLLASVVPASARCRRSSPPTPTRPRRSSIAPSPRATRA